MLNPFLVRPGSSSSLAISENEVHIWLVQANGEKISLDFEGLLSSAEQERASRFKFETDRRRYVVAHAALRSILSNYVNSAARELQFDSGPYNKPKLAPIHAKKQFEFNLSHSHERVLIAVTRGREIGVDVERVREDFAFDEVAQRFFTPREVAALHALPHPSPEGGVLQVLDKQRSFPKSQRHGSFGAIGRSGNYPRWREARADQRKRARLVIGRTECMRRLRGCAR